MTVRLTICVSCRDRAAREAGRTEHRAGARLHALLADRVPYSVELVGHGCLSGCKRACAFALQGVGKWTYVFGDCDADAASVGDILTCVDLYRTRPDGFLERRVRPLRLQDGILSRLPPYLDPPTFAAPVSSAMT